MAIRSIVDIDVNDGRFKEFSAQFQKYQELLAKTPGAWANMDKSMQSGFSTLSSALLAQLDIINKTNKAEQDLNNTSNRAASAWRDISKSTKSVLTNIKDTTISLFKWASVGTLFTGLIGGGGLFGLDALARGTSDTRRQALGTGTTYGEKKAFDVNFNRIVSTDSFLSNINEALHDVNKKSSLYQSGLRDTDLSGKNTTQIAAEYLLRAHDAAARSNPASLFQTYQSLGYDKNMSYEDFQRAGATSRSELEELNKHNKDDAKKYANSDEVQKKWADLMRSLDDAGTTIEAVLVRRLVPLAPAFGKLADSVGKSIDTLLSSKDIGKWIDSFGKGVEVFAKYIGGKDFQTDIATFATDIGLIAKAIVDGLKWLGVVPRSKEEMEQQRRNYNPNTPWHLLTRGAANVGSVTERLLGNEGKFISGIEKAQGKFISGIEKAHGKFISGIEKAHGLPPGILWNIFGAESGYGKHLVSSAKAKGPYQLMDGTAARFGVRNPFDFSASSEGAAKYLDILRKEFSGDIRKVVASYNWGEGNVERDIKRHGADWDKGRNLPRETSDYLEKVLKGVGLSKGVKIDMTINNPAGAQYAITASQMAQ